MNVFLLILTCVVPIPFMIGGLFAAADWTIDRWSGGWIGLIVFLYMFLAMAAAYALLVVGVVHALGMA